MSVGRFIVAYKSGVLYSLISLCTVSLSAQAAETEQVGSEILTQVNVIGDAAAVYSIPGSAYYIDADQFRNFSYDDINRALTRVPGVYVRQEDGYGLFPNISLRGVDTSRCRRGPGNLSPQRQGHADGGRYPCSAGSLRGTISLLFTYNRSHVWPRST